LNYRKRCGLRKRLKAPRRIKKVEPRRGRLCQVALLKRLKQALCMGCHEAIGQEAKVAVIDSGWTEVGLRIELSVFIEQPLRDMFYHLPVVTDERA
jgi:hypothetical protein